MSKRSMFSFISNNASMKSDEKSACLIYAETGHTTEKFLNFLDSLTGNSNAREHLFHEIENFKDMSHTERLALFLYCCVGETCDELFDAINKIPFNSKFVPWEELCNCRPDVLQGFLALVAIETKKVVSEV